ncbi:MAG: hypothetical protein ABR867_01590 [Nitrososphaerales archaeon]
MASSKTGKGIGRTMELMFEIRFDNPPPGFAGTRWRSFIRRYSDSEIGHGLYTAKEGEQFQPYGETRQSRVRP